MILQEVAKLYFVPLTYPVIGIPEEIDMWLMVSYKSQSMLQFHLRLKTENL